MSSPDTDLRSLVGGMLESSDEELKTLSDPTLHALSTVLIERMMFARRAGMSFNGTRDLYNILGYNRVLSYAEYRARYQRGGIAKRIVEAYPKATWRDGIDLYEDEDPSTETEFEKAWTTLQKRLGIWSKLQRVDILAGLSTFAVLLIGAPGELSEPLPKGSPDKLLYLTPFSGGGGPGGDSQTRIVTANADAVIETYDVEPQSPRFGLPLTYRLKRTTVSSPVLDRPVHWTRILHVAEGLLADEVFGAPTLEPVWNLLDDLDKVTGGGAEAFWLRANAGLHLDVDKSMGAPGTPTKPGAVGLDADARKALNDKAVELQHQLQRVMVTRGVTATQLSSAVANFKDPADAIITQIAGTKAIPKRILVGSEMGQLASGQDKDNWNTAVQDRRTSYAGPNILRPLVDRLIEFGYLPKPKEYDVEWSVIEDLTEDEKASLAHKLADTNRTQGSTVFTSDWIREKTYGLPPLEPEELQQMEDVQPEVEQPVDTQPLQDQLAALEAAIQEEDLGKIGELLGIAL